MARRSLDRRSIAISFAVATVAALLAGFVTSLVVSADEPERATDDQLTLVDPESLDAKGLIGVELQAPDGTTTTLGRMGAATGAPTLVNFWQSTCAPCIEEMPLLEQASKDHPEVVFVGVALQDVVVRAQKLADQTGITYPWAVDQEGDAYLLAGSPQLPSTLLLGPDGSIIDEETGAFSSAAEIDAFLAQAD